MALGAPLLGHWIDRGRCAIKHEKLLGHREVLESIASRYRTGRPGGICPQSPGPGKSIDDRHRRFAADGTYDRIFAAAHTAADTAGELDWLVAADSSLMRVYQHGASARQLSGNAATVSIGHGRCSDHAVPAAEGQAVPACDTAGPAGIFA